MSDPVVPTQRPPLGGILELAKEVIANREIAQQAEADARANREKQTLIAHFERDVERFFAEVFAAFGDAYQPEIRDTNVESGWVYFTFDGIRLAYLRFKRKRQMPEGRFFLLRDCTREGCLHEDQPVWTPLSAFESLPDVLATVPVHERDGVVANGECNEPSDHEGDAIKMPEWLQADTNARALYILLRVGGPLAFADVPAGYRPAADTLVNRGLAENTAKGTLRSITWSDTPAKRREPNADEQLAAAVVRVVKEVLDGRQS